MGFLDDIVSGAGRAGTATADFLDQNTALGSHAATGARLAEIDRFAIAHGFQFGSMTPGFREAFPDLADEQDQILQATVMATSPGAPVFSGIGAGAMGAAGAAATRAAPSAPRAAQPGLPGMGSAQGTMPPPQFHTAQGANPAVPPAVNPSASQPPLPGFNGAPPPQPAFPSLPAAVAGPRAGVPEPPTATVQTAKNLAAWVRANPVLAGALGFGAATVASTYTAGGTPPAAAAPPAPAGPLMAPGSELGIAEANATKQKNQDALDAESPAQRAERSLTEQQAAWYKSQHEDLDHKMANMDLTDREKEELHAQLQARLDAANNASHSADVATAQAGETARNTATIAGAAANTATTQAGETARNTATIASANRNTDAREAGENTRTGYQGQVTQRGQDQQTRAAALAFVTQNGANLLASGRLSAEKVHNQVADFIATQKLPTEILEGVARAVTPMLPYMSNVGPGEEIPGTGRGSGSDLLHRAAGGKGHVEARRASDFNIFDAAKPYGGGAPAQPTEPIDVKGMYAGLPDASPEALAAAGQKDYAFATANTPAQVQMPDAIQGLMPQTQTPPMPSDIEQQIYNSMR